MNRRLFLAGFIALIWIVYCCYLFINLKNPPDYEIYSPNETNKEVIVEFEFKFSNLINYGSTFLFIYDDEITKEDSRILGEQLASAITIKHISENTINEIVPEIGFGSGFKSKYILAFHIPVADQKGIIQISITRPEILRSFNHDVKLKHCDPAYCNPHYSLILIQVIKQSFVFLFFVVILFFLLRKN